MTFGPVVLFTGKNPRLFTVKIKKGATIVLAVAYQATTSGFLTELDGISFPEAVERLADEAGVAMPAIDPQAAAREKKKASLYDVMQLAVQFFPRPVADGRRCPRPPLICATDDCPPTFKISLVWDMPRRAAVH